MKVFNILLLKSILKRNTLRFNNNLRSNWKINLFSSSSNENSTSNSINENHCKKEKCGCHSNTNHEDALEMELQKKYSKIIESINLGKYDDALDSLEDYTNIIKTNFGEDHPFYCAALNNKAFILKTIGAFDEATSLFNEVIGKYKRLYGDNNEKVVVTMHNLATLYKETKEFEKSLEIYEVLLKLIEKENIIIEGEKTGKLRLNIVANIYNSAGGLYSRIKNFKESDRLFQLASNIIKENVGENTLPMGTVLNNMGLSLKDQGKFDEAMEMYEKAYTIRKDLLDDDHPEIINIKHNIEQLKLAISQNTKI